MPSEPPRKSQFDTMFMQTIAAAYVTSENANSRVRSVMTPSTKASASEASTAPAMATHAFCR
jgi:hypothetical protein